MDSQETSQEETQLDNWEQKDCQSDCTSNCEDNNVKKSANGSNELQSSSNSHPLLSCIPESCVDVTESDSVNLVVIPDLELSLQTVASCSEDKDLDLLSTVINTTSLTSVNEDTTDSNLLMDFSSLDYAVLGSDILESSMRCSGVKSSTCSKTDRVHVDVSHEVQQSDMSTSSDGDSKLHLLSVCLQADEPINMTSECDSGKTKSSIDNFSVSHLLPEAEKEHKDATSEDDIDKIMSSIDDFSVSHLLPEAEKEHKDVSSEDDIDKLMSSIVDFNVSHLLPEAEKDHKDAMNEDARDKSKRGSDDSSIFVEINIKEEPYDSGYERSDLIYRCGTIIVGSDDDTDSTVFSDNEARDNDANVVSEEGTVEQLNTVIVPFPYTILRTEGEVFPEELPPLEYLTISPDEDVVLETLGTVTGIVGVLVIVKANISCPALYDDTVLFLDGRKPLGLIFEIFGTVEQPYYSVRFNSNEDIQERGIQAGDKVFFAPNADNLTKYVFIAELRKIKADDASWQDDNEPPIAHREYSDDEQERRAQRQLRNRERGIEENSETPVRRKKRRKKPSSDYEKDPQAPQLLQGDLNRNPFESKQQAFSSSRPSRWPQGRSLGNERRPNNRSHNSTQLPPQPPPTPFAFRHPRPPCPGFAERPGWNQQPGLLGSVPNAAMTGPPNRGHFTNNMFNSHQQPPRFGIAPFPPPTVLPPPPRHNVCGPNPHLPPNFIPPSPPRPPPPSPPRHNARGPNPRLPQNFTPPSVPRPPPPRHSAHGPNPHLPQNSMPPLANSFQTYFPCGSVEHLNTFSPPPPVPRHQMLRPPGFPMFCPSQPPPFVNPMFNQHRPPPPHLPIHR